MPLKIEFVLGLDHAAFSDAQLQTFLMAVSTISGAAIDQIRIEDIRLGCVTIVITLDNEAARKLLAALDPKYKDSPPSEDQVISLNALWGQLKLQYSPRILYDTGERAGNRRPAQKNIIFLVHGWLGGKASFGELPNFLEKTTGCQCRVFSYPTGFLQYSAPMAFVARSLDNWIRNELYQTEANFAIVAHSMGGVIVRDFLGSQLVSQRPLDSRVKQVTFVASPQSGAWLAKVIRFFPGTAATQVGELAPDSPHLVRVSSAWNAWVSRQDQLQPNVRSIFSTRDEVVDYLSAIGADPEAIPVLDANHTSIIKPQTEHDEFVRTLTRVMHEARMFGNN